MTKVLGEVRVEERDDCVALIVRTTDRWRPWDVFTIVENPIVNPGAQYPHRDSDDLTYGAPGFRAIQGMKQWYVEDVTYWVKQHRSCRSEEKARARAVKELTKFLDWRDKQKAIEAALSMEPA